MVATEASLTTAIQNKVERRESLEFELNASLLNALYFIKDAGSDGGFFDAHIARHLALGFDWSESKGAHGSGKSEEHNQQDLDIREYKVRDCLCLKIIEGNFSTENLNWRLNFVFLIWEYMVIKNSDIENEII